jgi:hypothetical protein
MPIARDREGPGCFFADGSTCQGVGFDDLAPSLGFDLPGRCGEWMAGHREILSLDVEPLDVKSLDLEVPMAQQYGAGISMSRCSMLNLLTSSDYRTMIAA